MENLHLTYTEAFEVIPYRNMLLMSRDKMHTCDKDDIVTHESGKDMMKRRMARMNNAE